MCDESEQSRERTDRLIRRTYELLGELTLQQRIAGPEVQYIVVGCQPPQRSLIQATGSEDGPGDEGSGTNKEDSEPGEMVEDKENELSMDDIYSEDEDDVEYDPSGEAEEV